MTTILYEHNGADLEVITEADAETGRKQTYLRGVFMRCDQANKNNRVYPKAVMESVVASYIKEKVEKNSAYGCLGHGDGGTIDPSNISHRITSLEWHGDNLEGKALILDEGSGRILKAILESGGRIGMSSKGKGSVKQLDFGLLEVQPDYQLLSFDAVCEPSNPEAYAELSEAAIPVNSNDDDAIAKLETSLVSFKKLMKDLSNMQDDDKPKANNQINQTPEVGARD